MYGIPPSCQSMHVLHRKYQLDINIIGVVRKWIRGGCNTTKITITPTMEKHTQSQKNGIPATPETGTFIQGVFVKIMKRFSKFTPTRNMRMITEYFPRVYPMGLIWTLDWHYFPIFTITISVRQNSEYMLKVWTNKKSEYDKLTFSRSSPNGPSLTLGPKLFSDNHHHTIKNNVKSIWGLTLYGGGGGGYFYVSSF